MTEAPACARHAEVPAEQACTRCGTFSCAECLVSREPPLCFTCAGVVEDPLQFKQHAFEPARLLTTAAKLVQAEAPRLLLLSALFAAPAALVQVWFVAPGDSLSATLAGYRVNGTFNTLIGIIGDQAMLALLIARSDGRRLGLRGALLEATSTWGRTVGAAIRMSLWVLLFSLMFVLPGIAKAIQLMFATTAALRVKHRDPLEYSGALVKGNFWVAFVIGVFAVLTGLPLTVLLFVVGALLGEVGTPPLLDEFVTSFIANVSGALVASVLYVGFVMLHRTAGQTLAPMRWFKAPPYRANQP